MDDAFTRRGFVGMLAAGAAGALWLPKARADRLQVDARWDSQVAAGQLRVMLHVKVRGSQRYEAVPRALELRASLHLPDGRDVALRFEPSQPQPMVMRTRSGRRIERRLIVGRDELHYETFTASLPSGLSGTAQLDGQTTVRGSLSDYAERHRPLVAAMGGLRATVAVQLA